MIVRPFVPGATYTVGDYVGEPGTEDIYIVRKRGDVNYDGPVEVDTRTPANDPDHFAAPGALPDR